MIIELVDYSRKFLDLSWKWLNDYEIKKLTNSPDFSHEQQIKWFKSLKDKKDYLIWGIRYGGNPIGACGLKNITGNDCEYWGYIGEKYYWGSGLGKQIINTLIKKAADQGLNSVWLQVNKDNSKAINLYKKAHFKVDGKNGNLLIMRRIL